MWENWVPKVISVVVVLFLNVKEQTKITWNIGYWLDNTKYSLLCIWGIINFSYTSIVFQSSETYKSTPEPVILI